MGETTSSFTYNGTGQRVSKTVGENTTDYVWSNSGSLPVVVYDGNYYVYGLGLVSKTDSQDGQLYYLTDGLASTTGLTDGEGNVVGTYTYDVFGAIRSETGEQANDYRFTGQQLDSETAFYYLRARYYDPSIGRFLTQDPIPFPNRYAYVQNNPVLFVDPYGYLGISVHVSLPSWGDVKDWAEDAAGAAGDFLTSPWGAPVLCNPLTGPLGCAVALGVNAPVTSGVEWALSTFSNCEPSDPKEGGGTVMANCGGLAGLVHWALGSPPGYAVGDTMFVWDMDQRTIRHEQGHLPQYDWLGDYFWPAYGVGLVTGAIACGSVTDKRCIHNKNFMEWWAR